MSSKNKKRKNLEEENLEKKDISHKKSKSFQKGDQNKNTINNQTPLWMIEGKTLGDDLKPLEELKGVISDRLYNILEKKLKLDSLFPVQSDVIPPLIKSFKGISNDVVVCAPTGSGKTLAFAIPIIDALEGSVPRTLRAVVILPTRDLGLQVFSVFQKIASEVGLKVASACGKYSFELEQKQLIYQEEENQVDKMTKIKGRCAADILVCTPGRLIDHLNFTEGLTLENLRFLVLDEADRLLTQNYQDFFNKLLKASYVSDEFSGIENNQDYSKLNVRNLRKNDHLRKSFFDLPLQKLIFSATISQNPRKLKSLQLHNPIFFSSATEGTYKLPSLLQEYRVICMANEKALALTILLRDYLEENDQVLVFTCSLDSTMRLFNVLKLMNLPFKSKIYSSQLSQKERNQTLTQFREGKIKLLVCSDVMARGIDVLNVKVVINYEIPPFVKTYVHRVGRTARAGNKGVCYSLLTPEEDKTFVEEFNKKLERKEAPILDIPHSKKELLIPKFQQVLNDLKIELAKKNVISVDYNQQFSEDIDSLKQSFDLDANPVDLEIHKEILYKLFLQQNKL